MKSEIKVRGTVSTSKVLSKGLFRLIREIDSTSGWSALSYDYDDSLQKFSDLSVESVHIDTLELDAEPGDFISVINNKARLVYSKRFSSNTVFATVRCNSNCIMCSQPPLEVDDGVFNLSMWYVILREIEPNEVARLGISGGEPTLLGDHLVDFLNFALSLHSSLVFDVLTNGRVIGQREGLKMLSRIDSPNRIQFCIPVYSGVSSRHDFIVQSKTSFWDTINAFYNANMFGFKTEVRLVVQKATVEHLNYFVSFVEKNLWFIDHLAVMGLEQVGYAKSKFDEIDVTNSLSGDTSFRSALIELSNLDLNVSLYNLPLCFLPEALHSYARRSISEWKNSFHKDCDTCIKRDECAGFFSWNLTDDTQVLPFA